MKKYFNITLTYYQVCIAYSLINLYCHGPICRIYYEALSKEEVKRNRRMANKFRKANDAAREEHPVLFPGWPHTPEAMASPVHLRLSRDALIGVVKAFKVALAEAETNNFWHMKIILGMEPAEISECFHVLESYLDCPVTVELGDLQSDAVPFMMDDAGEISLPEWYGNPLCCCDKMLASQAIGYSSCCRESHIPLYTSNGSQLINFCPWCGFHLPLGLRDLYCDTLSELGHEPFDDDIPEKYQTDAWWRERDDLPLTCEEDYNTPITGYLDRPDFSASDKKNSHCCEAMFFFLEEKKVAIAYDPHSHEYAIRHFESDEVEIFDYCPWCGSHLPESVKNHESNF